MESTTLAGREKRTSVTRRRPILSLSIRSWQHKGHHAVRGPLTTIFSTSCSVYIKSVSQSIKTVCAIGPVSSESQTLYDDQWTVVFLPSMRNVIPLSL